MFKQIEASDMPLILDEPNALKALASTIKAQSGPDGFYFVDEGHLFAGGEPSAEFQLVIEQLQARGVDVVIITSDNPNNLTTREITDQMTTELGLGSDANDTLGVRVIVCTFNKHIQNDYEHKEVECFSGDGYEGLISSADTTHAQEVIRDGYIADEPDAGFLRAFQFFEQKFEQRDALATKQAMPQPEATLAPYQAPANSEPVIEIPSGPGFYETNKKIVDYSVITSLVFGVLIGTNLLTGPRRMFVKGVKDARRSAITKFDTLKGEVGTGLSSFSAINSYLSASYPDQAEESRAEKRVFDKDWGALVEAQAALIAAKVSFFKNRAKISEVEAAAEKVGRISQRLQAQIEEKNAEAEDLYERTQAAQTNTNTAKKKLEKTTDWYEDKQKVFGKALPSTKIAFAQIQAMFDEAEYNSYQDIALALRGSDQAVEVTKTLGKFGIAVDAILHSYDFSVDTFRAITTDLANWPDLAVNPTQLVSSGQKLLDDAKAGVSIPDKLEEVVKISQQAEEQIRFAKDFSSAEATVLSLQDENNKNIKEINADVETATGAEFFGSHIQNLRDEAATALSKSNQAASQGMWSEAQTQLGILRVKTNETLAEMNRIDQLRKSNETDLDSIAKEVKETRVTYHSKTTTAWTDLNKNFKSDNYDESTETWNLLRKDMSKKEVANFSDHFKLIDDILTEVTDNPNDPKDIASVATLKNSMQKQEFDKATVLIRDMEKRLAHAQQLMDGLLERQKLARKSEAEYSAAIDNSRARLKAALLTVDTDEEQRFVDRPAEEMMAKAGEIIKFAEKAGKNLVFVAALEAATKATNMAIQAKKNAEDQIDTLRDLYDDLGKHKKRSLESANTLTAKVEKENDEVITTISTQAMKALETAISSAANDEKSLAALEDHDLAKAIGVLLATYDTIDNLRESLNGKLEADRASYQKLLNDLNNAISSATTSINSASSRCSQTDAGYAGDAALSSARSTLPSQGKLGDKRSSLQSDIKSAKSAEEYANKARSQANSAISAAETARALKAAQEAAIKRAADQAADRAREAATRITTTSNRTNGTRF